MSRDVELIRARIEALDAELIRVLGERAELIERLGRCKADDGLPVEDPQREAGLFRIYRRLAEEAGVDVALVERIFRDVHADSKARQHGERHARERA